MVSTPFKHGSMVTIGPIGVRYNKLTFVITDANAPKYPICQVFKRRKCVQIGHLTEMRIAQKVDPITERFIAPANTYYIKVDDTEYSF